MFVCYKCHEADEKVLNCDSDVHASIKTIATQGSCNICGKSGKIIWCGGYAKINHKGG